MTCADLIAARDWAATPLGPRASWPASLRATVANMLHTRQPMLLFWGPELIQLYNDAFVPSFGQGKHPAALGQRARECWADAWPVVGAQIEAVMARGEPVWFEDALVPIERNGRMEEVFWTYSYSPAFDDRGEIYGTLVIVTEMTGRVLAGRRLATLAQLSVGLATATTYEAAFDVVARVAADAASDLPFVVIRDPGGVACRVGITEAAAAALELVDAPRGELALRDAPPGTVWPEAIRSAMTSTLGSRGHILALATSPRLPLDDGYRSYLAQLVEQIASTLQRIDNAAASQAVQRQRDQLLMHAPVATALLLGPDHVFELANPLYCKVVGRDPVGLAYRDAFPELRDTPLSGILDRVYRTGEPFVVSEMQVSLDRHGHGLEDCFFNFNLEPLRDESETIYGMMAVAVDITDQVVARRTLEKIDEERSRVMAALEAANRTKDDFLAMLGHELRNPLAPIVSALELMNAKDPDPARSPERAMIERQVKHVVRLVDDLLDVSKITRGVLALEKQPVELAGIVRAAVESSARLIEQRRHTLHVELVPDVFVDGDESRLVQVFSNLMTNAARYTPERGALRVTATATPGDVVIEVTDNGIGIAPDLLPRVFDSFVQGARNADRSEGGLGLGLAIVHHLVAMHDGEVSASSPGPGLGATFRVRLPRTQPPVLRPAVRVRHAKGSKRILLVDDNADAAEMLGEIVRLHGHDVTIAHDPESALALLGELSPEIALLDIGLPGMDGYALATQLLARLPGCRLIALTGYGQDSDRARASAAGFAAHLVKPVKVDILLELLSR